MKAPEISNSTRKEREQYIQKRFRCIGDCELCGNCKILHGKDAEEAFVEYIEGRVSFLDAAMELRHNGVK